jgi:hypothetical protein
VHMTSWRDCHLWPATISTFFCMAFSSFSSSLDVFGLASFRAPDHQHWVDVKVTPLCIGPLTPMYIFRYINILLYCTWNIGEPSTGHLIVYLRYWLNGIVSSAPFRSYSY